MSKRETLAVEGFCRTIGITLLPCALAGESDSSPGRNTPIAISVNLYLSSPPSHRFTYASWTVPYRVAGVSDVVPPMPAYPPGLGESGRLNLARSKL